MRALSQQFSRSGSVKAGQLGLKRAVDSEICVCEGAVTPNLFIWKCYLDLWDVEQMLRPILSVDLELHVKAPYSKEM